MYFWHLFEIGIDLLRGGGVLAMARTGLGMLWLPALQQAPWKSLRLKVN